MSQALAVVTDKGTLEGLMQNPDFMTSLKTVLPKHLTPERIVKMALVAASRQPLLFKCTKTSVLQSLMKSAELGLDCSGTLGRAYLVPYYNSKIGGYECQFIPGYQGLIELARRSGNIARIESRAVYEKDSFNVEYGLDQKLIHIPNLGGDRGKINCVYAIAELMDGSRQIEIMTIEEIDGIMRRSKSKDKSGNAVGPWASDYSEMARKTVIRRLTKYLPLSTELAAALAADDEQYQGDSSAFGTIGEIGQLASRTHEKVVDLKSRLSPEPVVVDETEPIEDHVDPTIHDKPEETDDIDLDTATENLRSKVQELLSALPTARQKDLQAGKTPVSKADFDELTAYENELTA